MGKQKIFIAKKIPYDVQKYLSDYCECEIWDSDSKIKPLELYKKVGEAEGLLQSGIKIDKELLEHAPRLRAVSNISVGYNNFDMDEMKARKIIGTNTPGVLDETVADLIFGLILSSARRLPELDRFVKEGRWRAHHEQELFGVDVHHATLGIIGMGRIGEAVARRASLGFGMEVLYNNKNRKPGIEMELGAKYEALDTLLPKSDFVLLMTPITPETFHLMDYMEFSLMKKSAIFINASRGQTVNEKALIDALRNGLIRGAGLDVYDKEPIDKDNPLIHMDNVVTLPHIGSATEKTRYDMAFLAAKNLVMALNGEQPPNIVPELL